MRSATPTQVRFAESRPERDPVPGCLIDEPVVDRQPFGCRTPYSDQRQLETNLLEIPTDRVRSRPGEFDAESISVAG